MASKKETPKKTAPVNQSVDVSFAFERETKGAILFTEVDEDNETIKTDEDGKVVGSLYVRKSAMKRLGWKEIPDNVTITVKVGK